MACRIIGNSAACYAVGCWFESSRASMGKYSTLVVGMKNEEVPCKNWEPAAYDGHRAIECDNCGHYWWNHSEFDKDKDAKELRLKRGLK